MKNIQSIISNLRRDSLKRLNSNAIINKLLLTLPKELQKSILFGTLKGDTLLIATANKGVCTEINNFRAPSLLNAINLMLDSSLQGSESSKTNSPSVIARKQSDRSNPNKTIDNYFTTRANPVDCHDFATQNLAMTEIEQNLAILRKIKKIKAYIPKNILEILQSKSQQQANIIITEHYKERALGTFHINENSPFKEIFSAIKSAIRHNIDESKRAN